MADNTYYLETLKGTGGKQPATFVRSAETLTGGASSVTLTFGETKIPNPISAEIQVTNWGTCTAAAVYNQITISGASVTLSMIGGDSDVVANLVVRNH